MCGYENEKTQITKTPIGSSQNAAGRQAFFAVV